MTLERLPKPVQDFRKLYPEVWKAFNELGDRCHAAGPLDEKTRRLVKVALSMGAGLEGATHSAVRNARRAGITLDEINHVAAWLSVRSDYPPPFAPLRGPVIDLAAPRRDQLASDSSVKRLTFLRPAISAAIAASFPLQLPGERGCCFPGEYADGGRLQSLPRPCTESGS